MERAYREDELLEATIIDSEGYIYGKVQKIEVQEEKINLVVYESKADSRTTIDVDLLKIELLKDLQLPIGARIQGLRPTEILVENIKKELGLKPEQSVTDENYTEYAKRLGVPLPQRKFETERRESKGDVDLGEIKSIQVSVIGTEADQKVVKVILLNDPREATFRNIPVQEKVPYHNTDAIRDKLVLDSNGIALGYVDSVVLFPTGPGIRVYSSKTSDGVELRMLREYLDVSGQSHIARLVARYFKESIIRKEELEDFKRKAGLNFSLPANAIRSRSIKELVMDVPWNAIHKIGDVIILSLPLLDLKSKGYFIG